MHLLVIEDDPRLLRLLRRLLGQDGHVVEGAGTATEGLEIAGISTSTRSSSTWGCRTSMASRSPGDCARVAPRCRS